MGYQRGAMLFRTRLLDGFVRHCLDVFLKSFKSLKVGCPEEELILPHEVLKVANKGKGIP